MLLIWFMYLFMWFSFSFTFSDTNEHTYICWIDYSHRILDCSMLKNKYVFKCFRLSSFFHTLRRCMRYLTCNSQHHLRMKKSFVRNKNKSFLLYICYTTTGFFLEHIAVTWLDYWYYSFNYTPINRSINRKYMYISLKSFMFIT